MQHEPPMEGKHPIPSALHPTCFPFESLALPPHSLLLHPSLSRPSVAHLPGTRSNCDLPSVYPLLAASLPLICVPSSHTPCPFQEPLQQAEFSPAAAVMGAAAAASGPHSGSMALLASLVGLHPHTHSSTPTHPSHPSSSATNVAGAAPRSTRFSLLAGGTSGRSGVSAAGAAHGAAGSARQSAARGPLSCTGSHPDLPHAPSSLCHSASARQLGAEQGAGTAGGAHVSGRGVGGEGGRGAGGGEKGKEGTVEHSMSMSSLFPWLHSGRRSPLLQQQEQQHEQLQHEADGGMERGMGGAQAHGRGEEAARSFQRGRAMLRGDDSSDDEGGEDEVVVVVTMDGPRPQQG